MKKPLLIILALLLSGGFLYSQNLNSARITVFKPTDDKLKTVSRQDSLAGIDHNCIKWNIALLGRGVFLINWEFRVTGGLTVELGLGLTYEDFIFELAKPSINGYDNVWDSLGSPKIHICGEAGARYYLSGFDNFDGAYVEGTVSYRPYSFPSSYDMSHSGALVPGYDFLDGQFKVGYQVQAFYSDFQYDFYIGIGYRSATVNYYVPQVNGVNQYGVPVHQSIGQTATLSYPQFLFGFKLGYSF